MWNLSVFSPVSRKHISSRLSLKARTKKLTKEKENKTKQNKILFPLYIYKMYHFPSAKLKDLRGKIISPLRILMSKRKY